MIKRKIILYMITLMMLKGYMPYGFEYRGGQVGIVFLK
jgi:hypothetical protein